MNPGLASSRQGAPRSRTGRYSPSRRRRRYRASKGVPSAAWSCSTASRFARSSGWIPSIHPSPISSSRRRPVNRSQVPLNSRASRRDRSATSSPGCARRPHPRRRRKDRESAAWSSWLTSAPSRTGAAAAGRPERRADASGPTAEVSLGEQKPTQTRGSMRIPWLLQRDSQRSSSESGTTRIARFCGGNTRRVRREQNRGAAAFSGRDSVARHHHELLGVEARLIAQAPMERGERIQGPRARKARQPHDDRTAGNGLDEQRYVAFGGQSDDEQRPPKPGPGPAPGPTATVAALPIHAASRSTPSLAPETDRAKPLPSRRETIAPDQRAICVRVVSLRSPAASHVPRGLPTRGTEIAPSGDCGSMDEPRNVPAVAKREREEHPALEHLPTGGEAMAHPVPHRSTLGVLLMGVLLLAVAATADAQGGPGFRLGISGGVDIPVEEQADIYDVGWNGTLDVHLELRHVALRTPPGRLVPPAVAQGGA